MFFFWNAREKKYKKKKIKKTKIKIYLKLFNVFLKFILIILIF